MELSIYPNYWVVILHLPLVRSISREAARSHFFQNHSSISHPIDIYSVVSVFLGERLP